MANYDFVLDDETGVTVGEWIARVVAAKMLAEVGLPGEQPPEWSVPIPDEITLDERLRLDAVIAVNRRLRGNS